jgi:hypothetical protein
LLSDEADGLLDGLARGMVGVPLVGLELDEVAQSGIEFRGLEPGDGNWMMWLEMCMVLLAGNWKTLLKVVVKLWDGNGVELEVDGNGLV